MSDEKQPSGANSDVPAKVEIEPFEGFLGDNFFSRQIFYPFKDSKGREFYKLQIQNTFCLEIKSYHSQKRSKTVVRWL